MDIERLDRVAIEVGDLEDAVHFFGTLLGSEFRRIVVEPPGGERLDVALSPLGLELLHAGSSPPGARLRSFHLKVPDIEQAEAELKALGLEVVSQLRIRDLHQIVCNLYGLRIIFVAYDTPSAAEAASPSAAGEQGLE